MRWAIAATESRDPAEALLCVLTEGEAWRMEQRGGTAGRRAGGVQGAAPLFSNGMLPLPKRS